MWRFADAVDASYSNDSRLGAPPSHRDGDVRGLRLAILSDTHGCLDSRVAAEVAQCDWAVHAGDIGGLDVLRALRPAQGRVVVVRGNNDTPERWSARERDIVEAIAPQASLELPGGRLVVVHGHRTVPAHQRHAQLRKNFPDARAVVYGHTHRLVCDLDAEPWVLNPGAAGRARTYGGPSCLVLVTTMEAWHVEVRRFPSLGAARSARRARASREMSRV